MAGAVLALAFGVPESGKPPQPEPEDFDPVGQIIGAKYLVQRLIGKGGMGAVYEARHTTTHRRVAVKLLSSPELAQHPQLVRRFFQEARAGAIVESEHVVQIFDSGTDPGLRVPFMVMELLDGEDLERLTRRLGPLPPLVAAKIVQQAAIGLAKAHAAGVVHRDIKPANLFLVRRENGEIVVKLLDFGVAKVRIEHLQQTHGGLTRTGSLLGTPIYMSPEQAKGRSDIDARSDVWSLGVVLYELLSGQIPYAHAASLGELLLSICTEDIPLIQDRAPWIPPELAEVTHRAMSRDIEKRYAGAIELRDALDKLLPDKTRLTAEQLVPLTDVARARIAARFELTDTGMLHARSRDGLAVTQVAPPAPSRALPWILIALLAVSLIGALAVALLLRFNTRANEQRLIASRGPRTTLILPSGNAAPGSADAERAASAPLSLPLAVWPEHARATIDGREAPVRSGKLLLTGLPGEVRTVRLEADGRSVESAIAITGAGLLPSRLAVPPSTRTRTPASRRPSAAPAPAPDATKPKSKPKLDSDWPG